MNCSFQIRNLAVGALFILLLGSNPFLHAANVEEGITLYREGKYTAAIAHFENLLSGSTSRSERRPLYRFLGKSYESIGRNDKAVSAYEEAVQYDTRNWRRHRDLGGLYELSSLNQEALACYKKAYKLNPKEAMLLLDLNLPLMKL